MPIDGLVYGQMEEGDLAAVARLLQLAFAGPIDGSEAWVRAAGIEHMRVMRTGQGAPPVGCLLRIPMGQFFGGRSVKMLGIAGVAVAPEARGRGVAGRLMTECVREMARDGYPISTLYPSTIGLYRKAGYELAGHRFFTTIMVGRIDVAAGGREVRALGDADMPAVRACYAKFAARFDGLLDRGDYCWGRVRELRGTKYHAFGVNDGRGGLDGYIMLTQERDAKTGYHSISVSDYAFTSADAGRRLLRFLGDFGTMGETATVWGAPMHPLVSLMSSRHYRAEKKDYWMLRVLDVKSAFESRGYSPCVRAECVLDVRDAVVVANAGRWRVRIDGGRAEVMRTESSARGAITPELRCDIRAVAPLLSGLYSARQLEALGWLESDQADAASMIDGAIATGTPSMTDMF